MAKEQTDDSRELVDEELEARLSRSDFSVESPGLMQRLWAKIQSRIRISDDGQDMEEDIDLTSEEMSMLTAAKGNPFKEIIDMAEQGKKPRK